MSNDTKVSKFVSLVLRHDPKLIELDMDAHGWVSVDQLIKNAKSLQRFEITKEQLFHVVETNDKKRFSLNDDKTRIRANQGHSIKVDLQLEPTSPPDVLYHGTATRFLKPIMEEGLKSMNRTQVHLSDMIDTATNVGKRHGKLVILSVNAKQMHADGFKFFISANGVWLTDFVPTKYLEVLSYEGNDPT